MEKPRAYIDSGPADANDRDALRARRRATLYSILATNIIRELREAGYYGHELLGFASEVMRSIAEDGWDTESSIERAATPATRGTRKIAFDLSTDAHGRPILVNDRLILRAPEPKDQDAIESWAKEPRVRDSLVSKILSHVIDHLSDVHPRSDRVDLAVCYRSSLEVIGLVSLHDIDSTVGQAELGKTIGNPAFRGLGLAAEATGLIVNYGFRSLDLNRIFLRTLGANIKNIRLNERMGFQFEGVLQRGAVVGGKTADVVLMAMLRSEFESRASHFAK